MPAFGVISIPDANVWLALAFSDHVHHKRAAEWFNEQATNPARFVASRKWPCSVT
jgi:predicted nucleic acid-binding protein